MQPADHPRSPAPPQILLVEDEPTIAVTLGDDLRDEGYAVTHTPDGAEALRLVGSRRFLAVITDLCLPGASGLEVLRAARRAGPGTRVLVVTAHVRHHGDALAESGAVVLQKPFANGRVLEWLRAASA